MEHTRITAAFLVFIPHQLGFYENKLEVLKLALSSFHAHTDVDYRLMVFDNGSCNPVRSYLRTLLDRGEIDLLLEAGENVGKLAALRLIFAAAPDELVSFSDEDVFFYPGWAKKQLRLIEVFPRTAMVSGCAIRTSFEYGTESALELAKADRRFELSAGHRISDEREAEWAISTGRDPSNHVPASRAIEDLVLRHNGTSAFVAANHFQFLARRSVILPFLNDGWSGRLMGGLKEFEMELVRAGYLRLATLEKTTRHIGNLLDPGLVREAEGYGIQVEPSRSVELGLLTHFLAKLIEIRPVRGALRRIFYWLYWTMQGDE